jgi:hypothetical protein
MVYPDNLSFTGKTIQIRVNDETYRIHKTVICSTSEFFKNAVKLEWAGRDGKPIDLGHESREIFDIYLGWLYAKDLHGIDEDGAKAWTQLTKSYVLGEKFMDSRFQASIIREMIRMRMYSEAQVYPSIQDINRIYDGTVESSPARRFMVDLCVWKDGGAPWNNKIKIASDLHEDFADDLLTALLDQRKPPAGKSRAPWTDRHAYKSSP